MSDTYVAWNGQPYPWPPPDGWYQGSDGRWWAPGSGPEPHRKPQAMTQEQDTPEDEPNGPAGPIDQTTVLTKPNPKPAEMPSVTAGIEQNDTVGAGEYSPAVSERATNSRFRAPLLLAGVAVLVMVGAGLGFLAVRQDDNSNNNNSAGQTTTAVFGETSLPFTTLAGDGQSPDINPQPTTVPVGQTTTVTEPPTTTTAAETATTAAPTTVAEDEENALAWRADLEGKGIDSSELTEADIIDFGKSFCVFAVVSADADEFDTFRDKAQSGVAGALNEAQLNAAIDAAVVAFCPDDANRLGITS